jgi:Phycobilisome protein
MIASQSSPSSLAQQWARKYLENLSAPQEQSFEEPEAPSIAKKGVRAVAAEKLLGSLQKATLQAWSQTDALLADEIDYRQIDRRLVNSWEISQDAFFIYEKALELYTKHTSYSQVPFLMGPDIAKIRKKYTQNDPRVIGFVSMQFHYTSVLLKSQLSPIEKTLLTNCFQVIDDHLYMPLHRAYDAAANRPEDDPSLTVVRRLIDCSAEISDRIVERVVQMYPGYRTYSGVLSDPVVRISSRRDTEMFQIYLFVCLLEGSFSIIEDELFPLCIMLYPKLKVHWELIRQMLQIFGQEANNQLGDQLFAVVTPYLQSLRDMFSPEVFVIDN